jgi:hypothetical protein
MTRMIRLALGGALLAAAGNAAYAQTPPAAGVVSVTGEVPSLCFGGTLTGGGSFDLGVLVDTTTGLLRADLTAAPKTLTGAFCSARSRIGISATQLAAQNNIATPASGFSRIVDYRATASGWTSTAATFVTGSDNNPGSSQERATAFQGDITVAIDTFSTSGGNGLRLIADPSYLGAITVTLSVAN